MLAIKRTDHVSSNLRALIAAGAAAVPSIAPVRVPNGIPINEALASSRFQHQGMGVYKEASGAGEDLGKIWVKKTFYDAAGKAEDWLVTYSNDDNDIIRQAVQEEMGLQKAAALVRTTAEDATESTALAREIVRRMGDRRWEDARVIAIAKKLSPDMDDEFYQSVLSQVHKQATAAMPDALENAAWSGKGAIVNVTMDDMNTDARVEQLAESYGGVWEGSGAGFGGRDLSFVFTDESDAASFEKAVRRQFNGVGLQDVSIVAASDYIDADPDNQNSPGGIGPNKKQEEFDMGPAGMNREEYMKLRKSRSSKTAGGTGSERLYHDIRQAITRPELTAAEKSEGERIAAELHNAMTSGQAVPHPEAATWLEGVRARYASAAAASIVHDILTAPRRTPMVHSFLPSPHSCENCAHYQNQHCLVNKQVIEDHGQEKLQQWVDSPMSSNGCSYFEDDKMSTTSSSVSQEMYGKRYIDLDDSERDKVDAAVEKTAWLDVKPSYGCRLGYCGKTKSNYQGGDDGVMANLRKGTCPMCKEALVEKDEDLIDAKTTSSWDEQLNTLWAQGEKVNPKDIAIAPGIKGKDLSMKQDGATQNADVTVHFTDMEQALKFFQDTAPGAPSTPPPTPAAAEGDDKEAPDAKGPKAPAAPAKGQQVAVAPGPMPPMGQQAPPQQ